MDLERWKRLERLFHAAAAQVPQERARFLGEAAAGDEALRAEVQALLDTPASAAGFLNVPAIALGEPNRVIAPLELTGLRIGVYAVGERIGAGSMGEVYRAHDTALGRDVALKVLTGDVAGDADRLSRFKHEARVLASLNHPSIAQLYSVDEHQVTTGPDRVPASLPVLVMELVIGPTLADLLARGPMSLPNALAAARQIADALEAAHERGVVHRDLKPANVKVRDDGTIKVLDFGLAKVRETDASEEAIHRATSSPMLGCAVTTEPGLVVGTPAYMSPEQARGALVDRRADIWAFGCVLYEMLTGRRAFEGDDTVQVLANVTDAEPDWGLLPPGLSPVLVSYLRRCLHKDRRQRVRDIGDVRLALEGAFELEGPEAGTAGRIVRRRQSVVAAAALAAIAAGSMAWSVMRPGPDVKAVTRFEHPLPEDQRFWRGGRNVFAISPDGRSFVYNTNRGIHLRRLGELGAKVIPGTEGEDVAGPFFSPDGQSVGFFAAGAGQLKRIGIAGGTAVPIASTTAPFGVSWMTDDTIVFARTDGILRVPARGGTPAVIIPAAEGERFQTPQLLPDRDGVLFTMFGPSLTSAVVVQSLSTGTRTVVISDAANAQYLTSGHLVYTAGSDLFGVAFDPGRRNVIGNAVPLERGLRIPLAGLPFSASNDGTIAFRLIGDPRPTPVLIDRTGAVVRRLSDTPLDRPRHPAVDPAGERVALVVGPPGRSRVWIYYLNGRPPEPRTLPGDAERPVWSPTGDRLALGHVEAGRRGVYLVNATGGIGRPEPLFVGEHDVHPQAWSADGREILALRWGRNSVTTTGATDLIAFAVADPSDVRNVAADDRFNEYHGRLSPDGQWLAYGSLQAGPPEIFVRPFGRSGSEQLVSFGAGNLPHWSLDGTELFYVGPGGLVAVPVERTGSSLSFGRPRPLFGDPYDFTSRVDASDGTYTHVHYDVDPAGRFVAIQTRASRSIVIVQNWLDELKRLIPLK